MVKNLLLRGIGICFVWSKNRETNYLHRAEAQREPKLVQLEHTHHHQIQKYRCVTKSVWTLPFTHKDQRRARERVRKAQISEDLSEKKSSIAKKLSLMEDIKNVRENELMDRKKEREEEREHREKMVAIKEKELQVQATMKEKKLQTQKYIKEMEINAKKRNMERMAKKRKREMDTQILNADTSTMSEKRRALHEIICEKVINKWFT
ncbi:uncharacterized protein DS421_4g119930 [Arachis hypogaea]|nr:uncharacterized protein DS421_4g119930 [Arachis hypogaea]